jgi:hypothetical protein
MQPFVNSIRGGLQQDTRQEIAQRQALLSAVTINP